MKLSDMNFKESVPFSEMMETAAWLVEKMFEDPDERLYQMVGSDFLFLQVATRLFTDYSEQSDTAEMDGFMDMVISFGVDRYKEWLRRGAGQDRYDIFEQMVKRGREYYLDLGPLEQFVVEGVKALHALNQMIAEQGELSPDKAVDLLKMYLSEQEKETPPEK